ncbi:Nucleoside-diphosphate-sugar epimerase [Meinhardsimonia xiamenensis]|jgi:nucleoside-diphosphate-sugar epimerase|uniref:Nucleoside-diphosphate-sugar epimerase n=2 Tax=Meinhardsimonia xiamenensis TaxID=990712 RepID=A0A1G8Y2Z3_9RHOB|nr:nucleoside-diphosphate-sugar epimerase [Meinhardsimonia xiamenensis]SDJ97239.1 Nucleoside-diphosphate-sugar epimerase [Meinhardsimonia xiamenensis]
MAASVAETGTGMKKVAILGGGGMIGQKLARHIAANGLGGQEATLHLHDIGFPPWPTDLPAPEERTGDIAAPAEAEWLAALAPDVIFHLAAVVSGEAEQDFEKGWRVNVDALRRILEALRAAHEASGGRYRPRFVFASSIAVFGPPFPEKIGDDFLCAPQTSYGAQKAIGELMVSDFSRKGFIDGIAIRLPTICVRPGKPNKAASGFFSSIIREPLAGQEAVLPVPDTVRHWHASPRAAVGFLTHAATIDLAALGSRRALNMPGVSCTVVEQIEALRRVAGEAAVARIRREPDPAIMAIVEGWPRDFAPERALALGFRAERDFEEIIRIHIEDELGGAIPG